MGRRAACASLLGLGAALTAVGAEEKPEKQEKPKTKAAPKKPRVPLSFKNEDFYGPDGKFNEEAAKKAYFALCRYFNYPVNPNVRKNLAVSDFALGHFTEAGLAYVAWVDEKAGNYCSLELFLLPGQMIPEHWHVAVEGEDVKAKMESWIVRYGKTFTYGEGDATEPIGVKIPEFEKQFLTVMHEKALGPGEVTGIAKPLEKHWQQAGPEGCILTEVSTYHTGAAVRFTNPKIKF
jgi:hypothetical protein